MKNETATPLLGAAVLSNLDTTDRKDSDAALMAFCDIKFANLMNSAMVISPADGGVQQDEKMKDLALRSFLQRQRAGGAMRTHAAPILATKKSGPSVGLGPRVYIGFDAEWQFLRKGRNRVLSVQFCLIGPTGDAMHKVIHLVGNDGDAERPRLAQAIYDLLDEAEDDGVIEDWPMEVVLCGFFTRADITVFSDFKQFRQDLSGVGGTLVTVGDAVGIELPMSEKRLQQLKSRYQYVVDQMPATASGLAVRVAEACIRNDGVALNVALNFEEKQVTRWNNKTNRAHMQKKREPKLIRGWFEPFLADAYVGGRNECFMFGPTQVKQFFDPDLAGA